MHPDGNLVGCDEAEAFFFPDTLPVQAENVFLAYSMFPHLSAKKQ